MKKDQEKNEKKETVVYGGGALLGDKRRGFVIFVKKKGEWERMAFGVKGIIVADKVKGGLYEITGLTDKGANFGRFAPTGEMCKDKEVLEWITKNELEYGVSLRESAATATMKKQEHTILNMTLRELKDRASGDHRFAYSVRRWVETNF